MNIASPIANARTIFEDRGAPPQLWGAHQGMMTALDAVGRAGVLIGGDQCIIVLNRAAERLMGDGILISRDRLRAASRLVDSELQGYLRRAPLQTQGMLESIALPRADGRPMVVHAVPIGGAVGRSNSTGAVLVLLDPLQRPDPYTSAVLARAFQFTVAEQALARRLVSGDTPARAARALGVSISTVRTHLKSIFAKTQCHSQVDLAALLSRTGIATTPDCTYYFRPSSGKTLASETPGMSNGFQN